MRSEAPLQPELEDFWAWSQPWDSFLLHSRTKEMRVLYGVAGEGLGHAMRSAVVAEHLENQGHDVRFVSSGSAYRYLNTRWPGKVIGVLGLRTVMSGNAVMPFTTMVSNVLKQTFGPITHAGTFIGVSMGGKPDIVISDFEPWTARYASFGKIPLIALDNIHFMNRCEHPPYVVANDRTAAAIMYPTVNAMVPNAKQYLVTTFASAGVAKPNTTLHLPILRKNILNAVVQPNNHVTAYFNEDSNHEAIVGVLRRLPYNFIVYGNKFIDRVTTVGNVTLKPFSEIQFIHDLASSSAVIGGAGFTLMSECIYLGKPLLAVPFGAHFEQILNANYLEMMGYGQRCRAFEPGTVEGFLKAAPSYKHRLSMFRHDGNRELLQAVSSAIVAA